MRTAFCPPRPAGYQCVPDPHATPGAVSGEEGGQAGHQSLIHSQHHPGGLQDPAGQHAGSSRRRIQDRHGILEHLLSVYTGTAFTWIHLIFSKYYFE